MEELKSILKSSPTDSPVHPDPRAHNMGTLSLKIIIISLYVIILLVAISDLQWPPVNWEYLGSG